VGKVRKLLFGEDRINGEKKKKRKKMIPLIFSEKKTSF
jgi:hypothetical protein